MGYSYCDKCNKVTYTMKEAKDALTQYPDLKRIYFCQYSQAYHTTKKPALPLITTSKAEDVAKTSLQNVIIDLMRKEFRDRGTATFTSKSVFELLKVANFNSNESYLRQELSKMRKTTPPRIVDIERKSGSAGHIEFTLPEILEAATVPNQKKDDSMANATPATVSNAASVKELADLLRTMSTQLSGLAQAYTEINNKQNEMDKKLDFIREFITQQGAEKIVEEVKEITTNTQIDKIIQEYQSFIQQMIGNVQLKNNELRLQHREGVKDGIQIAAEMNLTVRD